MSYLITLALILFLFLPINLVSSIALIVNTISAGIGPMGTLCKLTMTRDNRYLNIPMFIFGGLKYLMWFIYGVGESAFPIAFS